jgi:hypothetical protein
LVLTNAEVLTEPINFPTACNSEHRRDLGIVLTPVSV